MNFRSTVSEGRARGENADVSEGGRRRCTESVTCRGQSDIQLIISGNCPARGVLSACESTLVVIRSGRVAERAGWQEGRRGAPCVEPKRRATTGVAASRRCTSLVDRRGRELGGGSRLGSAEAAAATGGGREAGRSRKASRVQASRVKKPTQTGILKLPCLTRTPMKATPTINSTFL